ncbi:MULTISPECIES: 3-hydroxyanthranilate 3,4-dioxygenase [Chromobacterium]|uniref:3-hydroxyanthranilate 3,4-dioxygenase n=1 Tax=Chromobacterium rhizoryzae TaxID=1778675 RepID=A0AAD0W9H3_9NEIS|nr:MULTISPECIES: 3-hydroxyanthranilate 3,4-dioxygenase [Chromobacterium]AXT46778.1 3-hydroxyanthranilate 3,4-dioxygenase [Chromobacterium rhizoryzae]QOD85043.1 3-hydroxyanthranilate 3,4-dioxygenase [Chromobacterium haemolyticum]
MELQYGAPLNLLHWAQGNQSRLKPPVCNAAVWPDGDYIINMVGGPNTRTDFHDNPTEEIFYQIQGNAYLEIWDRGRFDRIELREGDAFLLPAHVIHSPQRPEPGLCLLVEKPRPAGEHDSLQWFCPVCATEVWRFSKQLESLVDDLPKAYQLFYARSEDERRCRHCGTVHPGKDYAAWHGLRQRSNH